VTVIDFHTTDFFKKFSTLANTYADDLNPENIISQSDSQDGSSLPTKSRRSSLAKISMGGSLRFSDVRNGVFVLFPS
jgi:hypothetical protein